LSPPPENEPTDEQRLAEILDDSKFDYFPTGNGDYQIALAGVLRAWDIRVRSCGGWLSIEPTIMAIPTSQTVKAKFAGRNGAHQWGTSRW